MKRFITIIAATLGFVLSSFGQFNPQPKGITKKFFPDPNVSIETPGISKKKGFMVHEELETFLKQLSEKHPSEFAFNTIGYSQEGRAIFSVHLPALASDHPVRYWAQGGLHGDEPASSEGLLHFLTECLENPELLTMRENVEILIIPVANVDGYEKNNRYAANGLDLNRDQTKLMMPETQVLKTAFSAFNPHVAVDFHEYRPFRRDFVRLGDFGVTARNDVMFLYTGNLNVPVTVREMIEKEFVDVAKSVMDEHGYVNDNYSTSFDSHGEIHFNSGSFHSRSSATNYALNNTISTLVEVRGVGIGRTSFLRRTHITYLIAESYLRESHRRSDHIIRLIEELNPYNDVAHVQMKRTVEDRTMTFIDVNSFKEIKLNVTTHDANRMISKKSREIPAYYILPEDSEMKSKLKNLGINYTYEKPQGGLWFGYEITAKETDAYPYEGRTITSVDAIIKPVDEPEGNWIYIPTQQRRRALLVEIFEPETENGWVHFSLIPAEKDQFLELYRYHINDKTK